MSNKKQIPSNSMELKQLAEKALSQSNGEAKWIAVDKHGFVYCYSVKPVTNFDVWDIPTFDDECWYITEINHPENWETELYEISKILNNEQ